MADDGQGNPPELKRGEAIAARIASIGSEGSEPNQTGDIIFADPPTKSAASNAPPVDATGLRFDGKVAVVTGAGNGLGKEYAKLLASRGAKVFVNDLGCKADGSGSSKAPADQTVAEITEAGGEATANYESVTEGEKIISAAITTYGRVDILINNAGISRDAIFRKMTDKDWDLIYKVDLLGTYKCTRAAWSHMEKQKFGRVVNVASPVALYGNFGQTNHAAMKMGILGFSTSLKEEGEKRGIAVNTIAPFAATRFSEPVMSKELLKVLKPATVAKLVIYLCHETCTASGDLFEVAGLQISKVRWQRSRGIRFLDDFSVEDLAEQFERVGDFAEGAETPTDAAQIIRREGDIGKSKPKEADTGKSKL